MYKGYHLTLVSVNEVAAAAAAAKSLQSCPTLCDPIDGSPPGSPVPGILRARTLEWVAISFPNAWKWKVKVKSFSRVRFLATPWTAAYQAPPSMGFSRQEYWSGVPNEVGQSANLIWNPHVKTFHFFFSWLGNYGNTEHTGCNKWWPVFIFLYLGEKFLLACRSL